MGDVIGAGELHKGVKLLIDGEPWEITEFDFSKPGKGQAIYNCKLRNMITGGGMSRSYRSGDKFERPELPQLPFGRQVRASRAAAAVGDVFL